MNKQFSKGEIQMANKYMKKCSTSLALRKMQMKTRLGYHLTLLKVAKIWNTECNSSKDVAKGAHLHTAGGLANHCEHSVGTSSRVRDAPYDRQLHCRACAQSWTERAGESWHYVFTAAKVSAIGGMDKETWHIYSMKYYIRWNSVICSRMDSTGGHYVEEICWAQKDKQCLFLHMGANI